jgi:hypothetical protein
LSASLKCLQIGHLWATQAPSSDVELLRLTTVRDGAGASQTVLDTVREMPLRPRPEPARHTSVLKKKVYVGRADLFVEYDRSRSHNPSKFAAYDSHHVMVEARSPPEGSRRPAGRCVRLRG